MLMGNDRSFREAVAGPQRQSGLSVNDYIIAWKLCTTMKAVDVTDTLELALKASGCDQAKVVHKPRLLSDNGSSYFAFEQASLNLAQLH